MNSSVQPVEALGDRVLTVGLWTAAGVVAAQTLAHWTNAFVLDGSVWNLDADAEGNAFTWASSAATFAAAVGALLCWATGTQRRRSFLALAAILALFSFDDVVQLHEQLGLEVGEDVLGLPDYLAVRLWTIFYFPLLIVTAYLLWDLPRVLWRPAGQFIRAGLALLVGAIVVEMLGAGTRWLEERGTEWPNDLRTGVEEALEVGAWILIASGLLASLCVSLAGQAERSGDLA
jgi:hypothetical protein